MEFILFCMLTGKIPNRCGAEYIGQRITTIRCSGTAASYPLSIIWCLNP